MKLNGTPKNGACWVPCKLMSASISTNLDTNLLSLFYLWGVTIKCSFSMFQPLSTDFTGTADETMTWPYMNKP